LIHRKKAARRGGATAKTGLITIALRSNTTMTKPKHITIMPELADWLDPLEHTELALLKEQIARDGLIDPICWAPITRPDGTTAEAILDGHHRYAVCREVGAEIPASKWRRIEGVGTITEARRWMYEKQAGRRNWSPNRQAVAVAALYEEAKIESGRRTDVHGGGKVDTAEVIGEQFKITGRAVRDCVRFVDALDKITDAVGVDARAALLSHRPPIGRETVIELAEAPNDLRRDAWEQVVKRNTAGVKAILSKAKRAERQQPPGSAPRATAGTAMARYDLADLVRLIATNWPVERLEEYAPNYPQQVTIEAHADSALRSLIWIAEHHGWGEAALDQYRGTLEEEVEPVPDAAGEPIAAPEPPGAEQVGNGEADLRQRLAAVLDQLGMSAERFAGHAGIKGDGVERFLAGKALSYRNRPKVETALADLAGYA
jgi:hypothetical protein